MEMEKVKHKQTPLINRRRHDQGQDIFG
jgi:hypothetical protein